MIIKHIQATEKFLYIISDKDNIFRMDVTKAQQSWEQIQKPTVSNTVLNTPKIKK